MTDYFNDYSSFIAAKGLPSPADTPYETPGFLRSKRSSRATAGSSREQSPSPPPLPPDPMDFSEKGHDGRFASIDPRRFTPTLHASLVSEILSLRRDLESNSNLVQNLEASLSAAQNESESLAQQLATSAKEVRLAKRQVQQMEKGAYDVVEDLVKERDAARETISDLKAKLDAAQKLARQQDEDALRTQRIWESDKENWENERRQLERRVHVTEVRLRTFVDELASQQASQTVQQPHADDVGDESLFKDSGLGNESDSTSVPNSPVKHRRNLSSISYSSRRSKKERNSISERNLVSPEPTGRVGFSLADELDIDEEDEDDLDEFEPDDGLESPVRAQEPQRDMVSRQSNRVIEDLMTQRVQYVDTGYQPSPPSSPANKTTLVVADGPVSSQSLSIPNQLLVEETTSTSGEDATLSRSYSSSSGYHQDDDINNGVGSSPQPIYHSASTQTDVVDIQRPLTPVTLHRQRNSLSPPSFVPAIAIHPPTSRPSTPRNYVLPPRTKNASTQANIISSWSSRSTSVQTEGIRVDGRLIKMPPHLKAPQLLPSPALAEANKPGQVSDEMSEDTSIRAISNSAVLVPSPPPTHSPPSETTSISRNDSQKDIRAMPLRAINLPRPVLSAAMMHKESSSEGPLNRSAQYGTTKPSQTVISRFANIEKDSDQSDRDDSDIGDIEPKNLAGALPGISRTFARMGIFGPPKAVPEDKEISPERRPGTAESTNAAPAPSIASSRAGSIRSRGKQSARPNFHRGLRSRSPSFGSIGSSIYSTSTKAAVPPFPIPTRSSSRVVPISFSEGSQSPTPFQGSSQAQINKQNSLRKVQSAAAIRYGSRRISPRKNRRRRRSPNLTPVQSMAFESPAPTKFPIPEIPGTATDTQQLGTSRGMGRQSSVADSSFAPTSEEPNLVDAIAATMVGEWMLKYIRKRKSFGVGESEFPLNGEEGSVSIAAHGSRHKRWVWLSPYEHCIMWDNKQPTNGNALLGKKGRKLAIQSVMDVQDDTPAPRNGELASTFNRSILVLTPERALKFTASTRERHALWMTALSFLAESGRVPSVPSDIPPLPVETPSLAIPTNDNASIRRQPPAFGRGQVRDSIRLAKGKRPNFPKRSTAPNTATDNATMPTNFEHTTAGASTIIDAGADFPAVPRLYVGTSKHQRKRSNTAPRLPTTLSGLRSLSSNAAGVSSSSVFAPFGSSRPSMQSASSKSAGGASGSRHDLSTATGQDLPNFFEAVGTVRMEAFVHHDIHNGVRYVPAPPSSHHTATSATQPTRNGAPQAGTSSYAAISRRRGDSNLSQAMEKRRAGYVFDDFGVDPFRNF